MNCLPKAQYSEVTTTPPTMGGCRSPTARVQALPLPSETDLWQSVVVAPLTGMSNTIGFGVTA